MRLTRETLIKIARDTAAQRAKVSRRIICIYLTGSVLDESPLLGGTTDIDLVVIHDSEPLQPREVVRLSDDVHLDIAHYEQAIFRHPRHLRTDPWLGPFIYKKPMVLHDTQHWFDFIQAATGAQFLQPDYVIQRALRLAQSARQRWMDIELNPVENHAIRVGSYFQAIQDAGNALASLSGEPVSERRFFLNIPHRLQNFRNTSLTSGLTHLVVPENTQWEDSWSEWLSCWKKAYQTASILEHTPVSLHACRLTYFEKAISAIWEENITASLWLLARTWSLAVSLLAEDSSQITEWQAAMKILSLDEEAFPIRLQHLDSYLDQVEETIETWAGENGVSTIADI